MDRAGRFRRGGLNSNTNEFGDIGLRNNTVRMTRALPREYRALAELRAMPLGGPLRHAELIARVLDGTAVFIARPHGAGGDEQHGAGQGRDTRDPRLFPFTRVQGPALFKVEAPSTD